MRGGVLSRNYPDSFGKVEFVGKRGLKDVFFFRDG